MEEIYVKLYDKIEAGDHEINESSEIQRFFDGQTIFLTGCTGFMGKIFVEKLLRSCNDIKRLYVLVRPKKLSSYERMQQYFDNVIFDRLREEKPNFQSKISIVEGNLLNENLGLSEKDRAMLVEETTLIYHNASNVKFDVIISTAIRINVMGTRYVLDLAMECKQLVAFVYISTAFSHCYKQHIEEKFYPPPGDMKMMTDIIAAEDSIPGGMNDEALRDVLGQWPNAYLFTKSTAESLVEECAKKVPFPCSIFRPSMVISTYLEPIRGWCGNINGPVGAVVGNGIGFVHAIYKGFYPVDYVPADMCANAIIATTWDSVVNKKFENEGIVYNYGSSTVNPITLKEFQIKSYDRGGELPSIHTMGPYYSLYTNFMWHYWLIHLTVHLLTALFADFVLLCKREKPKVLSYWILLTKNSHWLYYFANGNWRIHVHRMKTVWDRMNRRDSELFNCDLRKLNWDVYCYAYWAGIRVYILNDPMNTLKAGLRKYNRIILMKNVFTCVVRISIVYFVARWLFNNLATFF